MKEALAGRAEGLKERTLGIEVFGKDPNYDTTEDPIVRVTAGEIRKRIAQYYQEQGHEHEIKLLMPSGLPSHLVIAPHRQWLWIHSGQPGSMKTTGGIFVISTPSEGSSIIPLKV